MNDEEQNELSIAAMHTAEKAADASEDRETHGEFEKLMKENEGLKLEILLNRAREQMTAELKKSGARSPDLLFGAFRDELQFDGEGRPANTEALVAHLKERFPEQFEPAVSPGPIDAAAGVGTSTHLLTREALSRMTPAEIQSLDWAEVRRVLASNH
jgi:hypothetical protein